MRFREFATVAVLTALAMAGPTRAAELAAARGVLDDRLGTRAVTGDFNADGLADVAVFEGDFSPSVTHGVAVLVGDGRGALAFWGFSEGGGPLRDELVAADFDDDGLLDVAALHQEAGSSFASIFHGQGPTGLSLAPDVVDVGPGATSLAAADLDGDALADLAIVASDFVVVLLQRPDGTFGDISSRAIEDARRVRIGDVNADGFPDLVVSAREGNSLRLLSFLGIPGVGFGSPVTSAFPAIGDADVFEIELADLDASGGADVLVYRRGEDHEITAILGDDAGGFGVPSTTRFEGLVDGYDVADFDGDGRLDVTAAVSSSIVFARGDGAGSFDAGPPVPAGDPRDVARADFDSDGVLDVAISTQSAAFALLGTGGGRFLAPRTRVATTCAVDGAAADFDGDGHVDVVAIHGADVGRVLFLRGDGVGGLAPPRASAAGDRPTAVAVADFDEDGSPDLALAKALSSPIFVLANEGDGRFAVASAPDASAPPREERASRSSADAATPRSLRPAASTSVAASTAWPPATSTPTGSPISRSPSSTLRSSRS